MTSPVLLPPRTLLPLFPNASARNLFLFVLFIFVFWVVFMASKDHTEVRMVSYYIISQGGSERIRSRKAAKEGSLLSIPLHSVCTSVRVLRQWQADLCLFLLLGFAICLKIISSYAHRGCNPTIPVSVLSPRSRRYCYFFSVHLVLLRFPLSAVYFI